jgi:excisionase family DNA binding protein
MEKQIDIGFNLGEASKQLKISRPTLDKLIKDKQIKTIIYGFSKRIQQCEIDKYLEQFKTK